MTQNVMEGGGGIIVIHMSNIKRYIFLILDQKVHLIFSQLIKFKKSIM
jgi:hypothetical protein